ncbi:Gfo/Idh/MocA family oxidoreductase [Kribbella sandramycini]|uniref:Gfo/Idh/MocA family oxidoreductase n=1 Tax=Kribbella sandramycini TaxID=60450 RepID=A0A7Y4KXP6_9ACTN|nr:Gfo/Idh/MocA family oxidoreductase [Kribbella sandramycini]MBB6567481.1 putative dehydrogenase [Kribbella sandramycini]NOL39912.1 Gfo/Idh/MocA family oxidoreductase [Kribbella sandramycini]
MTDLRFGVVGLGARSRIAQYAHRPGQGSAVVAVADPVAGQREQTLELYPEATAYADHAELLDLKLDGVFLTTPDDLHEGPAIDFLTAGVSVFVEKPLAITTEGCDRVLQAAYDSGARLYVGHNMRHMPVVQTMRQLIHDGAIGDVKAIWCRHFVGHGGDFYFKDWHADRRRTTSLLLQKGAHDIDVMHWLAGGYTTRVNAMGALTLYGGITDRLDRSGQRFADFVSSDNWPPLEQKGLAPVMDVEDLSSANLLLDNGVLMTYEQCHFTPDYWRNYTVIGTHGRLENFGDTAGGVVKVWNSRRSGYREDADQVVEIAGETEHHGGADPHLVDEFIRFVRDSGATLTSPIAARAAVAAGYAATTSLRSNGVPVDVPELAPELVRYFDGGQAR